MPHKRRTTLATALALSWAAAATTAFADSFLDQIGITQLRAEAPSLTGTGVIVAQPEATNVDPTTLVDQDNFEIDPAAAGVTAPITYIHWDGSTDTTLNAARISTHANTVASFLAGNYVGVAPTLSQILNFNANYYELYVLENVGITPAPQVINQSFTQDPGGPYIADALNQAWDSFVAAQGVVIVSGAGNSGDVQVPATAYNVIAVGDYQGASSTSQAGQRAKPDLIVAMPAGYGYTSFCTPVVSGAAALLVQATNGTGDGADPRTIKALLLNGAVKPSDWTHSAAVPLDRRYGAGLLNVFNSYHQLIAGEQGPSSLNTTTTSLGGAHAPVAGGSVGLTGWNKGTLTTTATSDAVAHYGLDLSQSGVPSILTATLVWQRAQDDPLTTEIQNANSSTSAFTSAINTINNLDLFLYNANTLALVDQSTSTIDNVEHLYTLNLNPGKYDLQVLKNGGALGSANVSNVADTGTQSSYSYLKETYALAWTVTSITNVNAVANYSNLNFTQTNALSVGAAISGAGGVTQSGTGTTTLTGAYSATGPVAINAGKLAFGFTNATRQSAAVALSISNLSIASNAKLDVTNHDLIIGNTTLATVESRILAGVGVGGAGAPAITTSTAQAGRMFLVPVNADTWLGDGSAGSSIGKVFDGVTIAQPGTVLVKYTFVGDLNLDGKVDGLDFAIAASHNHQASPGLSDISAAWLMGDVTFNGVVDGVDMATMAQNYGSGYNLGVLDPQFIPIGSSMPVPEPTSLLVLGAGCAGLLMKRRRRYT